MQIKVWHVQGASALQTVHENCTDDLELGDGWCVVYQENKNTVYSLRFMQRAEITEDADE